MRANLLRDIEVPVRHLLERRDRLVLAVSGGVDSAVLLDAVARLRKKRHQVVVATIDHGTGAAATEAVAQTAAAAAGHGLRVETERLAPGRASEAEWRRQRWLFLRKVAAREGAAIATAHTRDDQVETVVMRLLRGAGARGIAGLYADSDIERPLLSASRADVQYYARSRHVAYFDDPTNLSAAFFRNRVRLNLLPAIRAVRPGFDNEILDLAHRAAQVRRAVDEIAETFVMESRPGRWVSVDAVALHDLTAEGRRLLWPALALHAGAALDRRGIVRLADLVACPAGSRVQVAGGLEAVRGRDTIRLGRPALVPGRGELSIRKGGGFGDFRFEAVPVATIRGSGSPNRPGPTDQTDVPFDGRDPWRIRLNASVQPIVREWVPGDRLVLGGKGGLRRVKRFLADAGIPGPLRNGWPVVVVGGDVVWIPGVRVGRQAQRGEGPLVEYRCERIVD